MATCYLDIRASKIQAWLARTDMLRLRRGASILLETATEPGHVMDGLGSPSNVQENREAAAVSGVIHLIVSGQDENDAAASAARFAQRLVTSLREQVPALTWNATWTAAGSYRDAVEMARAVGPTGTVTALPALADVPLFRVCDTCGAAPAVTRVHLPGEQHARVCSDCAARANASGDSTRLPDTHRRLLERFGQGDKGLPNNMEALARMGNDTQTALIFADGNRIGEYMARRASEDQARLGGQELTEATWEALSVSVEEISHQSEDHWPIVPHLVGGDDLLVSVPAGRAWGFVRALLQHFQEAISGAGDGPSMSAGLVFAHASLPFALQLERAESLLSGAKQRGMGKAAIAWADLTAGHPADPSDTSTAIMLEDLNDMTPTLDEFASWPRSMRSALLNSPDGASAHAGRTSEKHRKVVESLERDLGLEEATVLSRWWS